MSTFEVDAAMSSPTEITVAQLARLIGLPDAPALVDLHAEEEYRADPRVLSPAEHHASTDVASWCRRYQGRSMIAVFQTGGTPSQAVAARLRHEGFDA